jgi:uncharacterized surface protein with fasciclin (FAS1) repeats
MIVMMALWSMTACTKDNKNPAPVDNNLISLVVADNFNLSVFTAVLQRSGQYAKLKERGPFTVLAPSDAAFEQAGYATPTAVATAEGAVINAIGRYHVLDGRYDLNKLPFQFNQELRSQGGKLYATRWVKGLDTVVTVNGARILSADAPASNGLVQVINRVLTPYLHDRLGDAVAAEQSITLFSEALKVSGLLATINGAGPFTIFAPSNVAMQNYGYATVQQIRNTDPEELKRFLRFHIILDRRFIYDYILSGDGINPARQAMLDGNAISVQLVADNSQPGGYSGIVLRGPGNTADVNMLQQDLLAGNGVLHVIDDVLRSTLQ